MTRGIRSRAAIAGFASLFAASAFVFALQAPASAACSVSTDPPRKISGPAIYASGSVSSGCSGTWVLILWREHTWIQDEQIAKSTEGYAPISAGISGSCKSGTTYDYTVGWVHNDAAQAESTTRITC